MPTFAERLKAIRRAKNLTITDLAESAGLSRQTIHNYESGERDPTWAAVMALAYAMGCKTDDLRTDGE